MADEEKARKLAEAKKKLEARKKANAKKAKKGDECKTAEAQAGETEASTASPTEPEAGPATATAEVGQESDETANGEPFAPMQEPPASLSQQSKARSTSFRISSASANVAPGPFSPDMDGETAPDIYRKHVARIDELEKESRRLAKEVADAEKRWQKAEAELADLHEEEREPKEKVDDIDGQVEKLRKEMAALQRQNDQLQSQLSQGGRHRSSPSLALSNPPAELEAQLQSKSATIESMELDMSRLRAQVERLSVSASAPSEQITALEEKLARAQKAAALAQREVADLKRNLERTSETAVKAGSEAASAETKVRTLQREADEAAGARDELARRADALEKKVATLTTLHKDQDARTQTLRRDKEKADAELADLRKKLEHAEADKARLPNKDATGGGVDDEDVDDLEDEHRRRLTQRVRELEAENTDLRRGIWLDRRKEMQVGPDEASGRFSEVDLSSIASPTHRRKSVAGFGDLFATGLSALTGGGATHAHDDLLDDEELDFDEDAFRRAREEEAKKRLERVREIKTTLKDWQGWRLDLVENRRGGGEGVGEIFDI